MEHLHFSWENPLFLWPFSIAMLVYQRVYLYIPFLNIGKITSGTNEENLESWWFKYGFSCRMDAHPPSWNDGSS